MLEFTDFNLEPRNVKGVASDYVDIQIGSDQQIGRFSGNARIHKLKTQEPITIRFISNENVTAKGFKFTHTSVHAIATASGKDSHTRNVIVILFYLSKVKHLLSFGTKKGPIHIYTHHELLYSYWTLRTGDKR